MHNESKPTCLIPITVLMEVYNCKDLRSFQNLKNSEKIYYNIKGLNL